MVNIMNNEITHSHLLQNIEEFPKFLANNVLLKCGHGISEVDPRNYKDKNWLDVFLYEDFIVFVSYTIGTDGSNKKFESCYPLSDMQFFLHEKNILSMERSSGQPLTPDGSNIRMFRLQENTSQDWLEELKKCDVRVEMKNVLEYRSEADLPDVLEEQEFIFNNSPKLSKRKSVTPVNDYKNKPIGDCRPRSYSHDPEPYSPSHVTCDLSFPTMSYNNNNNNAADRTDTSSTPPDTTTTSEESSTTESGGAYNERISKRALHRSLSVDNTPRVCSSNNKTSHSLPSNLKSAVRSKKHSNNKLYQNYVNIMKKLTKNGRESSDNSSLLCKHIGSRYARPSPELHCKMGSHERYEQSRRSESESMVSILTLKPLQIAQELTRHHAIMLQRIHPSELRKGAWTCKDRHNRAPNVVRLQEFHNHLAHCLCAMWILQQTNIEKRAKVIKRLIMVAEECKNLNNFEAVFAIVQCLSMNCISRLSQTWQLLAGTSKMKIFTSLCSLVHTRFRWKNYRQALEVAKVKGYYIPILPQFLNYLEHSNLFYKEKHAENLVYLKEDNYSWTELSEKANSEPQPLKSYNHNKLANRGSFKWMRSKSLSTSPSPLRFDIEKKLRENVQSIVDQTTTLSSTGGKEDSGQHSNAPKQTLTIEDTPLYLLRLYQLHSAAYSLPVCPVVANFLQLPFIQCPNESSSENWPLLWSEMLRLSENLED